MEAVDFKDRNVIFAKDQEEYKSLPALAIDGSEGYVVTCWKLTIKDVFRVIFRRRVWVRVMTFGNPLQPLNMSTDSSDLYVKEK